MPSPTTGTDRAKVLSIRFTAEEFETLTARATEIGVGPSTLARTFVRQGLDGADSRADLEARVAALEKWVAEH